MSAYCAPCRRTFNRQEDLDRHLHNSSAHKKPTGSQRPLQTKSSMTLPLQQQSVSSRARPAEPQQAFASGSSYRIHTTTQSTYGQLPIEAAPILAPNIYTPYTTNPHVKAALQDMKPTPSQPRHQQPLNAAASSFNPLIATPQLANSPWSVILETQYTAVLGALSTSCHSLKDLRENNYIVDPYDPAIYVNSRKCKRCKRREPNSEECVFHPKKFNKWDPKKLFKCCRGTSDSKGCQTSKVHDFQLPLRAMKHKDYRQTPAASPAGEKKFRAVALDCEMAGIASGDGEAILLCITDYVTGAVLVNRLICPTERITQMRTSIHGISMLALDTAVSQGQALSGWEGARQELWKYIDSTTILVGHALQHDLDSLRVIHHRVVDSGILSKDAVGVHRQWGLQTLCPELLNFDIRENKGGIHDCMEDVLATREVVLFCTLNTEAFRKWAGVKRAEEELLEKEREKKREIAQLEKQKKKREESAK